MKIMLHEFVQTLRRHGLEIQGAKCCSMADELTVHKLELKVGEKVVQNVLGSDGFTFLGTVLTLDVTYMLEIRTRVASAWKVFWRMKLFLLNRRLSRQQRLMLWN